MEYLQCRQLTNVMVIIVTNKEAIEIIKMAIAEVEWEYPLDYTIAFEKAIEALELITPKEPLTIYEDEPICPTCRNVLDGYEEHCIGCDQRIDWSDW